MMNESVLMVGRAGAGAPRSARWARAGSVAAAYALGYALWLLPLLVGIVGALVLGAYTARTGRLREVPESLLGPLLLPLLMGVSAHAAPLPAVFDVLTLIGVWLASWYAVWFGSQFLPGPAGARPSTHS